MAPFTGYQCSLCGETYSPEEVTYTCPQDGGNLDVLLDYEAIRSRVSPESLAGRREGSIWRYLELLPVDDPSLNWTPLKAVGWTPLFRSRRLGESLGLTDLWVKDDGRNPTASFKDRASAVVLARAMEIGVEVVITASTGNAGAALAGMAAATDVQAVILAPRTAPEAKIAQLLIFGAVVILVEGTYDEAFDLSLQAADHFGWYCRNTGYNPFTAEGKKTAAFEIAEQLTTQVEVRRFNAGWEVPDALFVSVGDGNIISGLHKGFKDLKSLGWTDRIPRIFGVQSTGSAAITHAYQKGTEEIEPVEADTLADSIAVDLPRDGLRALRAATQTSGAYVAVEDEEILTAMSTLGQQAAVFAEPAGATAFAGLVRALEEGLVSQEEWIVVLNTGSGLKDIRAAMESTGEAAIIQPSLEELERVLK